MPLRSESLLSESSSALCYLVAHHIHASSTAQSRLKAASCSTRIRISQKRYSRSWTPTVAFGVQRSAVLALAKGGRVSTAVGMGVADALPQGITPFAFTVGVAVAITPALGLWLAQPLLSARARENQSCESEDVFWKKGANGERTEQQAFPSVTDPPSKSLSVIVPAHNEEDRLPGMLKSTVAYLGTRRRTADSSFTYEIIVIDDGSTDATAAEVERWVARLGSDAIRLLRLKANQGKGAAVRKGMLRMRGKYGIMVDADAATDIEDLDRLLIRMRDIETEVFVDGRPSRHGMVVGSRAHMEGEAVATRALYRTVLMLVFHWCVAVLCTRRIKDTQCGFKLFTRDTAAVVFGSLHLQRWAFDIEMIYICQLLGVPMAEVAVNWREVPGSKLIRSKLDVITTSANMLRDMLCVKLCYLLGLWRVASSGNAAELSRAMLKKTSKSIDPVLKKKA